MPALYKLTQEMEELLDDENADCTAIEKVFGDIQKKGESICQFMTTLSGDIELYKAEERRIAARRKALENNLEWMKTYLTENMTRLQLDKIKAGTFTITLQDTTPSVVVDDEQAIPPRFFVIIPETKQLDKRMLSAAIKNGEDIQGPHLEQKKTIRIR